MTAKFFADTNIIVYAPSPLLSTQVILETANVLNRKLCLRLEDAHTEDLHHGMVFDGKLRVINPFVH
jgi:predicted nucleic acid-binding protein